MTVAASVGRFCPMLSGGKPMRRRARRNGPARPFASTQVLWSEGRSAGSSSSTSRMRAAARARNSSVSPATRTKVPLLCSPATMPATFSGSSGVSTRYSASMNSGIFRSRPARGKAGSARSRPSSSDASRMASNMRPLGPTTSDSSMTVPGCISCSKYTKRPSAPTVPPIFTLKPCASISARSAS